LINEHIAGLQNPTPQVFTSASTFLAAYYVIQQARQPCSIFGRASESQASIVASLNTLVDDVKKSFGFLKNHPLFGTTSTPATTSEQSLSTDIFSKVTRFLQQTSANDLVEFVTHPRFDDPTYLTKLAVA
jgi:hypothetical protein